MSQTGNLSSLLPIFLQNVYAANKKKYKYVVPQYYWVNIKKFLLTERKSKCEFAYFVSSLLLSSMLLANNSKYDKICKM